MSAQKFTFDTVFEGIKDVATDTARARKRHSLSQSQIDTLKAEAHAEGVQAGEVRALEAIAAGAAEAAEALREALARTANEIEAVRAHSAAIALAAARKLARSALASFPAAEVEQSLREAMHQAIAEPRITLRASPDVIEALKDRVAAIAEEEGFDGRVQIAADPALIQADCRIEWRGGGAERAEASLDEAINELIARHFADTAPIALTPISQTED